MFLSVELPELGFSDVNCSVFSDSGTERNRGTDDDMDDLALEPPGVINNNQSKKENPEDSDSHDDDDDIITSSRPDVKLFKDSPMREMLKAKDKSDGDSNSNTQGREIVLEDFLEPIGAFGCHKGKTELDDGGAQNDLGYSSQKCSGDEGDGQSPFGNVSRQHPLVERLVLPPNSDSENENTKRAHSDPGQYF